MSVLHLDLETRSDIDLVKCGVHIYARGKNTDVLCAAYAFDDEDVELLRRGDAVPRRVANHIESGGEVWAHNASFEREIINCVGTRLYGWPHLYLDQMRCTQAMAYAMAIPGSLDGCSAALGIDQRKDLSGKRLMLQLSAPKEITPGGKIIWWEEPEQLEKLYEYCRQDVRVERAVGHRMMKLSPFEQRVWQLDQKINSQGITVDYAAVTAAVDLIEAEKSRLNEEIRRVSGNQIATCTAVAQIKQYIASFGVATESLAKADLSELLQRSDLPPNVRAVLELRAEAGKASTAKLSAMAHGSAPPDYRIRGTFQYSGANTRRWAGRRIQLQNLPRPKLQPEVVDRILRGLGDGTVNQGTIDVLFGPPMSVISSCLRGFLMAAPGKELVACDFSAIEARVIAWLAGQESVLEIFRTHGKIYEHAAARIFGVPMESVTDSHRQVGKVAVLALGYQGGVGAFQQMARGYGVTMAPALPSLLERASPDQIAWAKERFKSEKPEISEEEFLASDLTKVFWRLANPAIVDLWRLLEADAIQAVLEPGRKFAANGKIAFKKSGSFLWCRLPSGGVLCYPYPEVQTKKTKWGQTKQMLTYMSEDGQTRKWQRFHTYGGSIAENVTQAVARDLLAEAMLRLDEMGFDIVAHVHDEIVCEVKEGTGAASLEIIAKAMSVVPNWCPDIPLKAAGFFATRYRK
jgi:DNA polymerase